MMLDRHLLRRARSASVNRLKSTWNPCQTFLLSNDLIDLAMTGQALTDTDAFRLSFRPFQSVLLQELLF